MGEGDESARDSDAPRKDDRAEGPAKAPPEDAAPAGSDAAERDSGLGTAILRIGASLDLETVLEEVVESARALTGAEYGVIATVDEAGAPRDFVTSGLTEERQAAMEAWPDALLLFGHLRSLCAPLRLPDLDAWVRALGCAPFPVPCGAFQATPMRHRGAVVGGFFLGGKAGGFTDADEAMLELFAQQAGAALANARAHRDERRARADLEALVETCPVGVAVLDAATGAPLSLNREARRILSGLEVTEASPAGLRDAVVCRRGDGREVRLGDLANAETVRAEEVEISVPDGKSVRALIDATPILSPEGGAVERVVVTLQDLAPFEALARARAEFLGLVSHELRAPLAAIRGAASTALEDPRDPGRSELRQYLRIVEEQAGRMSGLIGDLLDAGLIGAGMLSVDPAPEALADLVERARTAFAAGGGSHAVTVDLPEDDLPRVTADARRIAQVLENLLANAARHSPESAPIRVDARRDGAEVEVSVTDAGAGIPPERLPHLFRRHAGVGQGAGAGEAAGERAAGSGLGLVICRGLVEAHGGRIRAESAGPGRGARIVFTLPTAEEAHAAAVSAPPARDAAEKTPVLVVDDDPHALRQARDALAAAGYAPAATAEPGEISRLVETRRPALAVLDLVLPGVDGIELMRTLPALADLPGDLRLGLCRRRHHRARPGGGRGGLYRQALLASGAGGACEPGAAPQHRARDVPGRRSGDRPGKTPRHRGGPPGAADRDRIPAAARALARRRRRDRLRGPAAPGLGAGQGRPTGGAQRRHQAPPQTRRRRPQPEIHSRRARPRIPHARARQPVRRAAEMPALPGPQGTLYMQGLNRGARR